MKQFKQIPPLMDTKRINNNNTIITNKQRKWISPFKRNVHTLCKSNSNRNILHHNIPPIKLSSSQFNAILQPAISSNNVLNHHKFNFNNVDRNKGLHLYLTNHKHHIIKRYSSPQVVNTNLNMCYNIKPLKRINHKQLKQRPNTLLIMKDESSSTREDIHNLLY
jgi:hypothetical protein